MNTDFSDEEKQSLKLYILVNEVATEALKDTFDTLFPPYLLQSILQREEIKLKQLRILSGVQLNILFPISGVPASTDFDITLMMCLIRNIGSISRPVNGFDALPPTSETHTGADLARIKYYRNKIAHGKKITSSQFEDTWKDLSEAISRLNPSLKTCCDELKKKNITSEPVDCPCIDEHKVIIKDWEKQESTFVKTEAVEFIHHQLKTNKTITVTGQPGSGKSVLVQHVALYLRDKEGYTIIPCINTSDIRIHFKIGRKLVFISDDLCGKATIIQKDLDEWMEYIPSLKKLLSTDDIRLLVSCRSFVFKDPGFCCLDIFQNSICDLSGINAMTIQEKKSIALQYLSYDTFQTIENKIETLEFFPLMCYLYSIRPISNVEHFFVKPWDVYEYEINRLYYQDKTKFFGLLLIVLLNGELNISLLKKKYVGAYIGTGDGYDIFDANYERICDHIDIERNTSLKGILEQVSTLEGTFIKKSNSSFVVVHDKIFDFLCEYMGKYFQLVIINFAESAIIRDRTLLKSTKIHENECTSFIMIEIENERAYFQRLIRDISAGNVGAVMYNSQMKMEMFRSKLITAFEINNLNIMEVLSTRDRSLDTDSHPVTPLYLACKLGFTDIAHFILRHTKCTIDKQYFPLTAAAAAGNVSIVNMLLKITCPDINYRDRSGHTPLTVAYIGKRTDVVKILLSNGADANKRTDEGPTPLIWTCSNSYQSITDLLIKKGADINKGDYLGQTPLMWLRKGVDNKMFEFLIYKGADINIADCSGWTPLIWACRYGWVKTVDTLIQNNADINLSDDTGSTPLMIACRYCNQEVASYLLEKNADCLHQNKYGRNAFMIACTNALEFIIAKLIEIGIDIDIPDIHGETPLMESCSHGRQNITKLLLQEGASCNRTDRNGMTPLLLACIGRHYEIVKLLLKKNSIQVRLNKTNQEGFTALLLVCKNVSSSKSIWLAESVSYINTAYRCSTENPDEDASIVELLVQYGADIEKTDTNKWSPLMWATNNGGIKIANTLVRLGANINHENVSGVTIFQKAIDNNNTEMIELLVKHKELNIAKEYINTVRKGNTNMSICLSETKAFNNIIDSEDVQSRYRECINVILSNGSSLYKTLIVAFKERNNSVIDILIKDNPFIDSVFITACKHQNTELAYFLISKGADLDTVSFQLDLQIIKSCIDPTKALLFAMNQRKYNMINGLLCIGANVNISDENGVTPLIVSIINKEKEIFKHLMNLNADIHLTDLEGKSPLRYACECNDLELIDILCKKGADIENDIIVAYKDGYIPPVRLIVRYSNRGVNIMNIIYLICTDNGMSSDQKHLVARYLQNDIDKGRYGKSNLNLYKKVITLVMKNDCNLFLTLVSAYYQHESFIVDLLISDKLHINEFLVKACKNKKTHLAYVLMGKGAYLDLGANYDRNLQYLKDCINPSEALARGCKTMVEDMMRTLFAIGANARYIIDNNKTVLMKVSRYRCKAVVELFIKNGADIKYTDDNKWSSLRYACQYKNHEVVDFLIKKGADVESDLICAINDREEGIIEVLIKKKC